MTRIAATIPAFQAAPSVGDVVRRTLQLIPDVLVVDDGSRDGTAEEARRAGAGVLVLSDNHGKGVALRTAFDALISRGYSGIVTLDADGQHVPEEIPRLLEAGTGPISCWALATTSSADMGSVRRTSNRLSSWAISFAAGQSLSDVADWLPALLPAPPHDHRLPGDPASKPKVRSWCARRDTGSAS